jgi:energy-coupling factor transport system substrate-specific component
MSWPAASFTLLAVALAVGFLWFERTRPSARVVALVGTMAALAALGRVAFAPLPNVKPTTDLVLLSGYALGGAPGFAVGAVGALTSNLFFGQGPWTPWQMLGWGLIGAGGAGLARLTRRSIGRVPLALACAAAGIVYGVILNFSTWVTFTGAQTPAAFGAISAAALPFDLAHAAGNAIFCLVFGPALLRALLRFRARFEIHWAPPPAARILAAGVAALVVASVALGVASPAQARTDAQARALAARYLIDAQNADGGWGGARGDRSSQLFTAWAGIGLAADRRAFAGPREAGAGALDHVRSGLDAIRSIPDVERTILVVVAGGASPHAFGDRDLVAELLAQRLEDGSWNRQVNITAFGVLALRAAGEPASSPAVREAASWIAGQANRDGGFNFFARGAPSGIDDTGAALQALVAAGRRRTRVVDRGVAFLRRAQRRDGGFPLTPGGASNAQSTAWATQAIVAAGRSIARTRRRGSRSPLAFLRSLQRRDGSVRYSRSSGQTPVWVTAQALAALARRPLPVRPVRLTTASAPSSSPSADGDSPGWLVPAGAGAALAVLLAGLWALRGRARAGAPRGIH